MSTVFSPTHHDPLIAQNLAESILASSKGFKVLRKKGNSPGLYEIIRQTNLILKSCLDPTGDSTLPLVNKVVCKMSEEWKAEGMRKTAEALASLIRGREIDNYQIVSQIIDDSIKNLTQWEQKCREKTFLSTRPLDLYLKLVVGLPAMKSLVDLLDNPSAAAQFNSFIDEVKSLDIQNHFFFSEKSKFSFLLQKESRDLKTALVADFLENYFDLLFLTGGQSWLESYQPDAIFIEMISRYNQTNKKFIHLEKKYLKSFVHAAAQQRNLLKDCVARLYRTKEFDKVYLATTSSSPSRSDVAAAPTKRKREVAAVRCSPVMASVATLPEPNRLSAEQSAETPLISLSDFLPLSLPAGEAQTMHKPVDRSTAPNRFPSSERPAEERPFNEWELPASPYMPYSLSIGSPLQTGEEFELETPL